MGLKAVSTSSGASGPPLVSGNFVWDETPTGTINSTTGSDGNGVFTLANTPSPATSVQLYQTAIGSGTYMVPTLNYNISGATITYTAGNFPITGTTHRANYMKAAS